MCAGGRTLCVCGCGVTRTGHTDDRAPAWPPNRAQSLRWEVGPKSYVRVAAGPHSFARSRLRVETSPTQVHRGRGPPPRRAGPTSAGSGRPILRAEAQTPQTRAPRLKGTGMGHIEFRGYVASVLTQIQRELEDRGRLTEDAPVRMRARGAGLAGVDRRMRMPPPQKGPGHADGCARTLPIPCSGRRVGPLTVSSRMRTRAPLSAWFGL